MKVILYTSPTCFYCHKLKDFLKSQNIEFEEMDVSQNQEAAEDLIKKSGQKGLPVVDINGEIIVGFDLPTLKEKLGI